ncbi:integrase [Oceanobacillus picturae]|uniref:Integrase n=1 Tax=Oceanobacillus picturae TaxID=171693 RepID=A0A0U9HA20_9BACI|nr:tyrosine-type recombinase/integrase [Oceanobacillus picturae]GAQ19557.1 integrase [Oceanobacillus picturae]
MLLGKYYQHQDLIICKAVGDPVDVRNVNRRFDKFVERARLPKRRFHDMRYTHATLMLKTGVHPKIVSERLSHSSIEMTLDTYAHLLPSMQLEAVQLFSENLKKSRTYILFKSVR